MAKLPEGIAVVLIYKDGDTFRKTGKMTQYETILNGYRLLNLSRRIPRIYPVNNERKVHLNGPITALAFKEALTLEEFKEYLYD